MFIAGDNEFSLVRIKLQFHTVHPLLNRNKTLCDIGVKIPRQVYLGVISVHMVWGLKTIMDLTKGYSKE